MVDPKRHINVLSPEEQAFMEECENEFTHRFTDLDEEFMAHCQRESKPPPVVHPWNSSRRGGGGSNDPDGGGVRGGGNWRGESRFNDWDRRGGGGGGGGRPHFRGRSGRHHQYDNTYRRNDHRSSGDGDNYHNRRNHNSSGPDYRKPYERSGDRQYNQDSRR